MREIPAALLAAAADLFWDVDPSTLDPERHEDFILGRTLVDGDWAAVAALRHAIGDARIAAFVAGPGRRRLDRRTRRFFETVLDLPPSCETTSSTNASAPLFAP